MSVVPALTASGSRDPAKRPRPVPKQIREMIVLMVYGQPDDPDGRPLDFIEAAKRCEVKPDVARRWLDRPEVRAFLHAERRAFREAICCGNESALKRVRDKSENGMCVVASVRTLENLNEEASAPGRGVPIAPGFQIVIMVPPPPQVPLGSPAIDVTPARPELDAEDVPDER